MLYPTITPSQTRTSWYLLGSVTALGPLAMGIHVPGMGGIAAGLAETVLRTQLSVPVFIFAFGFGMFGAGDIVDRVGVRIALMAGLLTFIVGAGLAGAATELSGLLMGRVLMGVGAAFAIVVPRVAVASDNEHAVTGLARLAAIQSAVPAFAPLLGSGLVAGLGWRATFLLPAAAAVALLVLVNRRLPVREDLAEHGDTKPARSHQWVTSTNWLLPTAEAALVTAVFLVLLAQKSNLLARPFGLGTGEMGLVLGLIGVAFVGGSLVLVRTKDQARLQRLARLAFIAAMVLLLVGDASEVLWIIGLIVYGLANGILVPAAFAAVARAVPASKGSALGTAGAIQMLTGAIGGAAANALGGLSPIAFGAGGMVIALTVQLLATLDRGASPGQPAPATTPPN